MAITCDMSVDDPQPAHGQTITVTYTVTGNEPVDPSTATISGRGVVGGVPYETTQDITIPGTPSAVETFDVPTCQGLSFVSTSDPAVFTAVIP
jgi:hypothetical protein